MKYFLNSVEYDMDRVIKLAQMGQKIGLIKEYRNVSGLGLKDSKDAIETCEYGAGADRTYNTTLLINLFKAHLTRVDAPTVTKEEFMHILKDAVDNYEKYYFTDMLEAVTVLCSNINGNGGLDKIAKDREAFREGI